MDKAKYILSERYWMSYHFLLSFYRKYCQQPEKRRTYFYMFIFYNQSRVDESQQIGPSDQSEQSRPITTDWVI